MKSTTAGRRKPVSWRLGESADGCGKEADHFRDSVAILKLPKDLDFETWDPTKAEVHASPIHLRLIDWFVREGHNPFAPSKQGNETSWHRIASGEWEWWAAAPAHLSDLYTRWPRNSTAKSNSWPELFHNLLKDPASPARPSALTPRGPTRATARCLPSSALAPIRLTLSLS